VIAGDVFWFPFGQVDASGEEKRRPVLVVAVGPTGPEEDEVVLVAPITSSRARLNDVRRGDVLIDEDFRESSLFAPSVVRGRQVSGVPRNLLTSRAGGVSAEVLFRVKTIVRELLGASDQPPLTL
jgi:mRNA-degrading endonuclease toxin of MazEF toxin-antitoxin module